MKRYFTIDLHFKSRSKGTFTVPTFPTHPLIAAPTGLDNDNKRTLRECVRGPPVGGRSGAGQARLIVGDVNFIRHMQIDVNFN